MLKNLKIFFLFLVIVTCSYAVRDYCYQREADAIIKDSEQGLNQKVNFVPFLIESAMMYSYAQDVSSGSGIPEFDDRLTGMGDVGVNQQFTSGLEYILGDTYRLKNRLFGREKLSTQETQFEDDPAFADWCRKQIRLWAGIISGLIFLWLIALRLPWPLAFFGGLLHAVAPAAIARYTGQDIVRGNFALPLIVGTFLVFYWYLRRPSKAKLILAGLVSFVALATWDMTQIVFAVWGLGEILRLACLPEKTEIPAGLTKRQKLWLTLFMATLAAALLIPYHRTHLLIFSPLVVIIFPVIFVMQFFGNGILKRRLLVLAMASVGFYLVWTGIASLSSFAGNYGHFASLMKAKIQFLNVKPANPDLLDFDARSIWVPGMHSADRFIMKAFSPMAFQATILTLLLTLGIKKMRLTFFRYLGMVNFPLFMFIFYGLGFFLIVRYHVFTIIFIAVLLPVLLYIWSKKAAFLTKQEIRNTFGISIVYFAVLQVFMFNRLAPKIVLISVLGPVLTIAGIIGFAWLVNLGIKLIRKSPFSVPVFARSALVLLALFILMSELDTSLFSRRTYKEHQDFYFAETAGLIKWMRQENMEDEIIMADFNLSPLLKAYCRTKIILQPKFELGKTRENYRDFINIMFHGDEKKLADFCAGQNARIFIFDRGYPESKGLYSPRYIAAAHELKPESPANMMNLKENRARLRHFYEITPPEELKCINNRYIIFQVISELDRQRAEKWTKDAAAELKKNNPQMAARLIRAAIFADPQSPETYLLYRQLFREPPVITLRGY